MNIRELRHKVEFRAYRDKGIGDYNSKREFSEPIECWAKITPRNAMRLIDDVNSFGTERAVTHFVETRSRNDLDSFTYMVWRGEWYKIYQRQESEDLRFMTLGVIYERVADVKTLSREVFNL